MSTIEQEAIVADLQRKLAERDAEVERLREYVREADLRVGEQFMAAQRAEAEALRLLNRCGEAFDRTRAAERAREEAELVLQNARDHLPRKVQTTQLGDWDAEQCSIFDNGYNAALTNAHNLLNMPAGAIRKAKARDAAFLAASGGA